MKRIVLILLLSLTIPGVKAQDRKFSMVTTLGTGFSMSTPASTPILWRVAGHYHPTDHWAVGAGTGLSFYKEALAPLYVDVRYRVGRERRFTPWLETAVGYAFALSDDARGGFLLNPSFGVEHSLGGKMKLLATVGYESQEQERLKEHTDGYFSKAFEERLSHHTLTLRVGLRF